MLREAGRRGTVATIYAQREPGRGLTTTVSGMELDAPLAGRALVVIVDDRTAHSTEKDSKGPLVTELLTEAGFLVDGVVAVTADEVDVRNALNTAVIGGVAITGGVGTLWGAAIGAMLLMTINRALPILGIPDFWQRAVVGLLIIGAIVLDRVLAVRQKRRLIEARDNS